MDSTLKKRIIRLIKRLFVSKPSTKDFLYKIGSYQIWLPSSHKLPDYQKKFGNYDKKLLHIVKTIQRHESKEYIVDIGANVGDTAALMRSGSSAKIICVEGDEFYLGYLKKNAQIIPDLTIVDSFIKGSNDIEYGKINRSNGTAQILSLKNSISDETLIRSKTLIQILSENNINVIDVLLFKIDTDGFDFKILLGNKHLITTLKPNLFFEYALYFNENDYESSLDTITILEQAGYYIIVYDNFGNLLDFVQNDYLKKFIRLNDYLVSCRMFGGGINYFDLFATTNPSIAQEVFMHEALIRPVNINQ